MKEKFVIQRTNPKNGFVERQVFNGPKSQIPIDWIIVRRIY
jgi:hypothetical protein